jgi:hypothetical protein
MLFAVAVVVLEAIALGFERIVGRSRYAENSDAPARGN